MSEDALFVGVDHVAYAARDTDATIGILSALGFKVKVYKGAIDKFNIAVTKLMSGSGDVAEIVEPLASGSVVSKQLKDGRGGVYHVCFRTTDFEKAQTLLKSLGAMTVTRPMSIPYPVTEPHASFLASHMYHSHLGLFEITGPVRQPNSQGETTAKLRPAMRRTDADAAAAALEPIAIIGIGCRFPGGASGPAAFWDLLREGRDAITQIPSDRWNLKRFYDADNARPGKTNSRWGGFVDGFDRFDAQFFGISPREAALMDPQQRMALEVSYEAVEDAGVPLDRLAGSRTAVFVGISSYDYATIQNSHRDLTEIDTYSNTGGALSIAANRISYSFDLLGPSASVDTACSSALTAVHLACQAIWRQGCPMALAGGVSVLIQPGPYVGFTRLGMLSPDGRCRAFDARANGYVRSEGAGMVLLKPLRQALADGDHIYAAVRATAINQDGRSSGLTVPTQASQEALLREACAQANLDPKGIQYLEAHGTGTPVGDPIEARALGNVLCSERSEQDHCLIGSVKTNIGHLEAGSGAAGLIKAALAISHRLIPPNLHFEEPNPDIPFEELRLRVPVKLTPWPAEQGNAVAGVNSFGFGGANAHVLLSEVAPPAAAAQEHPCQSSWFIPLSARSPNALRALAASYRDFLAGEGSALSLNDLCFNLTRRRTHHNYRLGMVCGGRDELREAMSAYAADEAHPAVVADRAVGNHAPKLLWVCSGQGPQWWAMGRQLLEKEPVFRDTVRRCDQIIRQLGDWSLWEELTSEKSRSRMQETFIAQPALFAVQVALAALWRSWGIEPAGVVGHSVGEVAAAHIAGVLSLEDAVRVIFHRGRCMQFAAGRGRMLAVELPEDAAIEAIASYNGRIELGAVNAPGSVTLGGDPEPLEALAQELEQRQVFCRFLQVKFAFHSAQMDPAKDPVLASLADIRPQAAKIPLFSTVTGELVSGEDLGAEYWWQNVRRPVRFADATLRAIDLGNHVALELSPHPVLAGSIQSCLREKGVTGKVLISLRRNEDERDTMLRSLASLYTLGSSIAWEAVATSGQFARLPSYPWQRERYWHETEQSTDLRLGEALHPLLGRALKTAAPSWEARIDTASLRYLSDHCLQDQPLYPATAYLEMALTAAKAVLPGSTPVLEEVRLAKTCFLPPGESLMMQTCFLPSDGSFQIASRAADGAWTAHVTGILRSRQNMRIPNVDVTDLRERCPQRVTLDECYATLKEMGLVYGPSFQGIRNLWVGDNEALGEIHLPAGMEDQASDYHFHPALLDACVQVLFGAFWNTALADPITRVVYLPTEFAEVRVYGNPGLRVWSHARVIERTRQAVVTDVSVFSDEGALVWEARGLTCRQVMHDGGFRADNLQDAVYESRWQLQPRAIDGGTWRAADYMPQPAQIAADVRSLAADLAHERTLLERHRAFEQAVRPVCSAYAWSALRELAGETPLPTAFSADELEKHLQIALPSRGMLRRCLDWLAEDGLLQRDGANWQLGSAPACESPSEVWTRVAAEYPACLSEMLLINRCGRKLATALRRNSALEAGIAQGETSPSTQDEDAGFLLFDRGIALLAIGSIVRTLPPGRALRVLHLGAGIGSFAKQVLEVLPPDRTEYVATDRTDAFFTELRENLRDHPTVQYKRLDLERNPLEQGLAPHYFDIVLVSETLNAAQDLEQALRHLASVLSSEATLLLLEPLRRQRWMELVLGVDNPVSASASMITLSKWRDALSAVGFRDIQEIAGGEGDIKENVVIAARRPRLEVQQRDAPPDLHPSTDAGEWLILADRQGVAERLACLLRSRGEICQLVFRGEFDFDQLKQEAGKPGRRIKGLVSLWSLDAAAAENLDAQELQAAQAGPALDLAALSTAFADAGNSSPRLYVITRRALSLGAADQSVELSQSPLIGLSRVIRNEIHRLRCKTIDIGGIDVEAELAVLAAELCISDGPEDEDEIALRGEIRYVSRYMHRPLHPQVQRVAGKNEAFRLEVDRANRIEGLFLRAGERTPPGPGEAEVRVVASGLNFSDVLKAIGLYPGLADGPVPLGIECSGTIVAVGAGVSQFRVGDAVLMMAPFTLGAFVTVPTGMLVAKPDHLSFEEAATIPVAFMTAYHGLHHLARMQAGEKVLIHSAAGGVGLAAIQLAQAAGAEILATAGTEEKRDFLRALGVKHVMDSRSLNFVDEVMDHTGGTGVDIVLNSLGGEAISKSMSVLAYYGRFLEIGKRDIYQNSRLGLNPFRKSLSFFAIDLDRSLRDRPTHIISHLHDVVELLRARKLAPLPYRAFSICRVKDAFRHMSQGKHLGKIVVSLEGSRPVVKGAAVKLAGRAAEPTRLPINANATYLVSGGLGGFGLEVARWMVSNGARHLVLLGRSGAASAEAEVAVQTLRELGAEVVVARADIACRAQVTDLLCDIKRTMPPLRGIAHLAMVLDDCALPNLTAERWHRVQGPKVGGAWNLHLETQDGQLDFFVCFSSMSAIFGIPGQGSYAAANSFLDALAHYRRSRGLPALTINWGVLGEVGVAARDAKLAERFESWGVRSFNAGEALEVMGKLLRQDAPQLGVMKVDWSKFLASGLSRRFAHLARRTEANGEGTASGSIRQQLAATSGDARRELIQSLVRAKMARVLGTSATQLDEQKPLRDLGLDSIMGVELRNWIAEDLGIEISTVHLVRGPSIDQLVQLLLERLGADEGVVENALSRDDLPIIAIHEKAGQVSTEEAGDEQTDELATKVAQMSNDEVEAALAALVAQQDQIDSRK